MNWTDEGLLLSVKPHGERAAVIQVLTENKGLHAGLVQNAFSRKMNSTLQPSNQLCLNWSSRLEENLGIYKADLLRSRVDIFLSNKLALNVFNSISALCLSTLAERDPIPELYKITTNFLDQIATIKKWEFFWFGLATSRHPRKWHPEVGSYNTWACSFGHVASGATTDRVSEPK